MDWKVNNISDGTAQDDRPAEALNPGYFDVDELSFEELLAMAAEFSKQIPFYNLSNKVDGDWGELFETDEAVIMAMIISTNVKRIEAEFQHSLAVAPQRLGTLLFDLASRLNHWKQRLEQSGQTSGEILARKIAVIIEEKLAAEMPYLRAAAPEQDFAGFPPQWCLDAPITAQPIDKETMRALFYHFLNAISYIRQSTAILLAQSLDSGEHKPATGLLMVFLKLYQAAQKQLNHFTQRHLEFYYRRMLNVANCPEQVDSYYLVLQAQKRRERVYLEPRSEFSAGRDAARKPIIYRADEALLASDAYIAKLATLYLQHEPLTSPEAELGFVTRIKSARPRLESPQAQATSSWPLFGAATFADAMQQQEDARIGFCIASELLLLEQGLRTIDIVIEFVPTTGSSLHELLDELIGSESKKHFTCHFSRLFPHYLLTNAGGLSDEQKDRIMENAQRLLPGPLSRELSELLRRDWQGLFYQLLRDILRIKLSADTGWLEVPDYRLLPLVEHDKTGLRIQLQLGQDAPPITAPDFAVHGGELASELPLLYCTLNPQSHFCPYSLFQEFQIETLHICVEVCGLNNILAYNQHGQLDPAKPFQPFGPLPSANSFLVFGNYEIARKPLQALKLQLDWAELPAAGSFDEHYHGYKTQFTNEVFLGALSLLSDRNWLPIGGDRDGISLFESEPGTRQLLAHKTITIDCLNGFQAIDASQPESSFRYNLAARNGFLRLALKAPRQAFGHSEYPLVLSEVLVANARRRKSQAVPNPPYSPLLNRLTVDYQARATIRPAERAPANRKPSHRIIHLQPFGAEVVYPAQTQVTCRLLPYYRHEGNLFIGLRVTDPAGELTLLFKLSRQTPVTEIAHERSFDWYYLSANRWQRLSPRQILSDSTSGLLKTGIVRLQLPDDIDLGNSVMSADCYWLRVSVAQGAENFAACEGIYCNALKVTRQAAVSEKQMPSAPVQWSLVRSLPGITSVSEGCGPFDGRPAENEEQYRTRIGERLRHKNRASLAVDYEQLILERFPEVYKVKCFNGISSFEDEIRPGQLRIVVVPVVRQQDTAVCKQAQFSVSELERIRTYVQALSSPFARIEVRNPVYEQVQVRCSVRFNNALSAGGNIERVNRHISDYICPWRKNGYRARFGWSISQQDIESSIRSLSYIDFVTNFSMLHITVDRHGKYSLFDTAKGDKNLEAVVRPRYPWSLAVPASNHFIKCETVAHFKPGEVTGVDELAVGSTFIITGSSGYGEEE